MNTLDSARLAPLLERLFAEADAAPPPAIDAIPREELHRLMRSKTEYVSFYGNLKDQWLAVSRDTARLLYLQARSIGARSIVEFGTSFGLSTLHLAAALRDNGGGRLISTEFEPGKVRRARENLEAAALADLVDIRQGDALDTLSSDLPPVIDMVLLDGAKGLYPEVLALVQPRLRPGAIVVADDAEANPDYLALVRERGGAFLSCSVGDGAEISLRLH
ncbi:O-methyltransferase [Rhizosaccharibacter radicis]|uniref:Class I SAM-dependent methyltransferase n=1 Tax=Rhizosaccharibacter radicis TaxID=2782605 RepID=A0ABT1VXL0_9PROT|nr:class I SAM-dependent methyltransferase [Acetobacteraceae bacterium KSS12]